MIRVFSSSGKRLADAPAAEIRHLEARGRVDVKRNELGEMLSAKYRAAIQMPDRRPTGFFRVCFTESDILSDGRNLKFRVRHKPLLRAA